MTGSNTRLLDSLVDGDTSAKNGGDGIERNVFGDSSNVSSFGNAVLLEGSIDSVAGEEGLFTKRLVGLLAEAASQARPIDPLP